MVTSTVVLAQHPGSYLTISGGVGSTKFNYDLKGLNEAGENKAKIGGLGTLGYSYYFSKNWGISTGIGMSYYSTSGIYSSPFSKDNYYSLGMQLDDDFDSEARQYELRVRLSNWEERQTGYFVEIPLLFNYQVKFGEKQRHGIYAAVGAKAQIPVKSEYKIIDNANRNEGGLNVSGYYTYPQNIELGRYDGQDIYGHGYGVVYNPNNRLGWNGNVELKTSFAVTGEFGFLIGLSKRIDLTLGAYIDYGLNNIKKDNKELLEINGNYFPEANNNPGKGIVYNGMMNSNKIDESNLLSWGGKIGIRIKLGKIPDDNAKQPLRDTIYIHTKEEIYIKDTVIEEPVITIMGVIKDITDVDNIISLKDAKVTIYNDGLLVGTLLTLADGEFKFDIKPNQNYRILAEYDKNYFSNSMSFTSDDVENDTIMNVEINLYRIPVVITLPNIEYDYGKADLRPESTASLEDLVKTLRDNPNITIELRAHTDYRGSDEFNMDLSFRRAQSCINYLIARGIDPNRLDAKGLGESEPKIVDEQISRRYPYLGVGDVLTEQYILKLTPRQQEVANQLNRRTEFKVLSKDYAPGR